MAETNQMYIELAIEGTLTVCKSIAAALGVLAMAERWKHTSADQLLARKRVFQQERANTGPKTPTPSHA